MNLSKMLNDCLTESDNITHDLAKWLALLATPVFLGINIYLVGWTERPWTATDFGIGCGAVFAGLGLALKLKPQTESL
jgi:hypothetical protein